MRRLLYILTILLLLPITAAFAQQQVDTIQGLKQPRPPVDHFYIASGLDGLIISNANIDHPGFEYQSVARFTTFFHLGLTLNYNMTRNIGAFTGIDVKNIGIIEHNGNVLKHRTYNVGVPVGIKIGNMMPRKFYCFLGGGVDFPVNYKEKSFSIRASKDKFYEWFSHRTPFVTPYVFAGISYYNITLKAQYYPVGFFNQDYVDGNGDKPYAGYDVHIYMLSMGYIVRRHGKVN
jgi:hypothetical protein